MNTDVKFELENIAQLMRIGAALIHIESFLDNDIS